MYVVAMKRPIAIALLCLFSIVQAGSAYICGYLLSTYPCSPTSCDCIDVVWLHSCLRDATSSCSSGYRYSSYYYCMVINSYIECPEGCCSLA